MGRFWFRASILLTATAAMILSLGCLAQAQTGGEPTWPQNFQIPQGESRGFAFVVTQPGPITISVSEQGSPVVLYLFGPVTQPIQTTGSGTLNLSHNVTAAEVQKSAFWIVNITSSGAAPALRVAPRVLAQGTIAVQHPAGDMRLVQTEFQSRMSSPRAVATATAIATATVSPKQAANLNQIATQQAAKKDALVRQISAKPVATAIRPVSPQTTAPSVRTSGGSNSGQTGGSTSAVQSPPPQIASMSVNQGQPGDPVLINGSGFGNTPGEVHFIVNPGPPIKDDIATQVDVWSDTQILVHVPSESGIQGYNGQAYVKNANGRSQLVLFQFVPQLQFVSLDLKIEQTLQDGGGQVRYSAPGSCRLLGTAGPPDPAACVDHSVAPNFGSALSWHSNDDQFFPYLQLKPGWVTDSVELRTESSPGGGAYLAEKREGTNSPFAKVHWWVNPMGEIQYTLSITIRGPNGVPYR